MLPPKNARCGRWYLMDPVSPAGSRLHVGRGTTEPAALRRLLSIGPTALVRCYEVGRGSFHPKAYLFDHTDGSGRAFIGSANLSRNGLVAGIEWTWTVMEIDVGQPFTELRLRFTDLFESALAKPLTPEWIDAYQSRRVPQVMGVLETADDYAQPMQPRPVQVLALQELDRLRATIAKFFGVWN